MMRGVYNSDSIRPRLIPEFPGEACAAGGVRERDPKFETASSGDRFRFEFESLPFGTVQH